MSSTVSFGDRPDTIYARWQSYMQMNTNVLVFNAYLLLDCALDWKNSKQIDDFGKKHFLSKITHLRNEEIYRQKYLKAKENEMKW